MKINTCVRTCFAPADEGADLVRLRAPTTTPEARDREPHQLAGKVGEAQEVVGDCERKILESMGTARRARQVDTHQYAVWAGEGFLDLVKCDERSVFEIVREAEGFDVFLEARGDLALVPPEAIALQLGLEACKDMLYFAQLLSTACRGAQGDSVVGVGRFFQNHTVEEKYGLFGKVSDIAACLKDVEGR